MAEPEEINIVGTILEWKRIEPFEPFRIVLCSGDKYLIESGENLVEMRSQFFYVSPRTKKHCFLRKSQIAALEKDEMESRNRRTRRKMR